MTYRPKIIELVVENGHTPPRFGIVCALGGLCGNFEAEDAFCGGHNRVKFNNRVYEKEVDERVPSHIDIRGWDREKTRRLIYIRKS